MGRDVTGLCLDRKHNGASKSNDIEHMAIHVASKNAVQRVERNDSNVEHHMPKSVDSGNGPEKQDVLGVKSINYDSGSPDPKTPKSELLKSGEKNQFLATGALLKSTSPSTAEEHSNVADARNVEAEVNGAVNINDINSPNSEKVSKPTFPLMARKDVQPDESHYHDEDNISLASSAATSVRTTISRITVPLAPKFVCGDRLSRRREFYTKLEEKHKALEAEKVEVVARTKEEEQAAIKQLRKSMVYKANPVPTFYREGPPPKVELKKLPVTRAKSPNLNRRKSCSDAVKSSPNEKGDCVKIKRHSVGVYKEGSSTPTINKHKDVMSIRNVGARSIKAGSTTPTSMKSKRSLSQRNVAEVNQSKNRPKDVKETSKSRTTVSLQEAVDISTVEEVKETSSVAEYVADVSVVEVTKTSLTSMKGHMSTDIAIMEELKAPCPERAEQSAEIAVDA